MTRTLTFVLLILLAVQVVAQTATRHGQVRVNNLHSVWSEHQQAWLSPTEFWQEHAKNRGGLTWGTRTEYPEYNKVKEHDLMIIVVDSGPCLMEFFHTRWRRANDVRRWDPAFDNVGGCASVFD